MRPITPFLVVLGIVGCAGEEAIAVSAEAVTCAAHIVHYPVGGPYNGGYDPSWNDFRCDGARNNSDYGGAHHGNDIFAPRGTPIVAPVDGVVTRSGVASASSGNRVTIEDGCGWSYYHGHLDSIAPGIVVGARVHAGQVIGTLGDTGTTGTAPHLHFNVHRDGNYDDDTDPFPLLQPVATTACGADPQCAGRADGPFCSDATHLSACTGGRFTTGDCAAYGTTCGDAHCLPHIDGVFVGSDFPGGTRIEVPAGREVHGCLTYRNIGSWDWERGTTNLGTTEPRDHASPYPASDWLGANRIATIGARTPHGATGRFCFSLRGAEAPGSRVERFSLVHDAFFWAADVGGVADTINQLTVVTVAAPPPPPVDAGPPPAPDAGPTVMPMPSDGGAARDAGDVHRDGGVGAAPDAGPSRRDPRRTISGGCSASHGSSVPWSTTAALVILCAVVLRSGRRSARTK